MSSKPLLQSVSTLPDDQLTALDRLLDPLSPDQLAWISGYAAGIATARRGDTQAANLPAQQADAPVLTVLYGSQSGNGARVADQVRGQAAARGFSVRLKAMDEYRAADLRSERNLLIIVSTHGEGDPPDAAKDLYEFVHGKKAGKLADTRYSVLALGDTSYQHFCKTGREFDARLQAMGAQCVHPRVDCDVDYEDAATEWIEGALSAFATDTARPGMPAVKPAVAAPSNIATLYSRKNPFPATTQVNLDLSGHGSGKEVRHLELSLEGAGLNYEPGDSLGVIPANDHASVVALLHALALDPEARIDAGGEEATLEQALSRTYEITTLTRPVLEKYAELCDAEALRTLLREDHADELWSYMRGRQLLDIVEQFPVRGVSATELTGILRKLPPRLYSIASSHKATPDEVHLTVAAVRYESHGRKRKGVASCFLAERVAEGDPLPIYVEVNRNFKLPADSGVPIIMVGPGTGVAPFRAFVQERQAIGARGGNWLFFGDRHFTTDFLYQREWQQYLKDGILTRMDVAFSRDQPHKIYVQQRMKEKARDLYAWLQDGARFYVCGDGERMAHDVHQALVEIVADQGHLSLERAQEYVQQMQRQKRYQRDVY